jgi:hypothetical protein
MTARTTAGVVGILFTTATITSSLAGVVAAAIHLSGAIAGRYGAEPSSAVQFVVMDLPIFAQEMIFALWLIIRGFYPAAFGTPPDPVPSGD